MKISQFNGYYFFMLARCAFTISKVNTNNLIAKTLNQVVLAINEVTSVVVEGVSNATTSEPANVYVSDTGQIMKSTAPANNLQQATASPPLHISVLTNWNPGSGSFIRVSKSTAITVNSVAGGVDGRIIVFTNVGAGTVTFVHNSSNSSSLDVNEFLISNASNVSIETNHSITFIYDSVDQRWRDIAYR